MFCFCFVCLFFPPSPPLDLWSFWGLDNWALSNHQSVSAVQSSRLKCLQPVTMEVLSCSSPSYLPFLLGGHSLTLTASRKWSTAAVSNRFPRLLSAGQKWLSEYYSEGKIASLIDNLFISSRCCQLPSPNSKPVSQQCWWFMLFVCFFSLSAARICWELTGANWK